MPVYALFVIVWSSALLVLWRQRCSELAYRWLSYLFDLCPCVDPHVSTCRSQRVHGIVRCHLSRYCRVGSQSPFIIGRLSSHVGSFTRRS